MKPKLSKPIVAVTVLLVLSHLFPCCLSENYSFSYELLDGQNDSTYHRLNIAVSQSLHEYYLEKSHRLSSNDDFAKLVTPFALKPIADSLWEIYADDEDFANGVLTIVHQIPYEETLPVKYPVETIVQNAGDCDLFSFVASSIMKAGGLDVVLLYYEAEAHMNVGVHLSHSPIDVRGQAHCVTYNDIQYYVAECTGDDWRTGWRVGECPDDLKQASLQVITLENSEQWAPGQVSSSYQTLEPSAISLAISSTYVMQGSTITLSGHISPHSQNRTVVVYIKKSNLPWSALGIITTDSSGRFAYAWTTKDAGLYYVRASWSGDDVYAGADSPVHSVTVFSTFLVFMSAVIITLICACIIVSLLSRQGRQEVPEPPEIPV